VGAWIEILARNRVRPVQAVAPCVGAWIEIGFSWQFPRFHTVAPCVGAWIEILSDNSHAQLLDSRSLRGSVD